MNLHALVPVRGIQLAKKKLRETKDQALVNMVVQRMLNNTISCIRSVNIIPVLLTAEDDIKIANVQTLIDDGQSLNVALEYASKKLLDDRYLLVMADLPGLTSRTLEKFMHLSKRFEFVIAPVADGGTALALLPAEMYAASLFGGNSYERILDYADEKGYSVAIIEIQDLKMDLDDDDDWIYWQGELPSLFV
ncbi:MAG: hypothetical protein INQ03_01945 [Candidatus Heimdallarchaeota archaeon]|nr:hypothetical protein [Candidatus Heimdallarchaeota archaeon]